jgi:AcrR family transcriptional regulator
MGKSETASELHPSEGLSPERRARIVAGAEEIFIADGYEGASMSRIAASANVSKGTLYNYFPSKTALFAAFVEIRCNKFIHDVFDGPQQAPAGQIETGQLEAELSRIGRMMLKMMISPTGQAVFRVVVMEAAKFPELAKAFMAAGPQVMVGRLTTWLTAQNAAGRLNTPEPQFAAEQFFALTQTRLVLRARTDPEYQASPAEIEQVINGAVKVFLSAYLA